MEKTFSYQREIQLKSLKYFMQIEGVILFSMGTVSNTTNMPTAMTQSFLQAFGQIADYDFLWKTEQVHIPGASKFPNVHLRRWIPQKTLIRKRFFFIFLFGFYVSQFILKCGNII
jgi:UDP:flavonoid glycosyltransferase YjiC (YdhE family)